jgi:hypothetical protein
MRDAAHTVHRDCIRQQKREERQDCRGSNAEQTPNQHAFTQSVHTKHNKKHQLCHAVVSFQTLLPVSGVSSIYYMQRAGRALRRHTIAAKSKYQHSSTHAHTQTEYIALRRATVKTAAVSDCAIYHNPAVGLKTATLRAAISGAFRAPAQPRCSVPTEPLAAQPTSPKQGLTAD